MSRSRKKSPCHNPCSAKKWKQTYNRCLRHKVKQMLHVDPECNILPIVREVSDTWDGPKDGYWVDWDGNKEHAGRWSNCILHKYTFYTAADGTTRFKIDVIRQSLEEEYKERLEDYKKAMRK